MSSAGPDAPEWPTGHNSPPPDGELSALLWVTAVLVAVLELAWWISDRTHSP